MESIHIIDVGQKQIIAREYQKYCNMIDESTILSDGYKEKLKQQAAKAIYEVAHAGDGQIFPDGNGKRS